MKEKNKFKVGDFIQARTNSSANQNLREFIKGEVIEINHSDNIIFKIKVLKGKIGLHYIENTSLYLYCSDFKLFEEKEKDYEIY